MVGEGGPVGMGGEEGGRVGGKGRDRVESGGDEGGVHVEGDTAAADAWKGISQVEVSIWVDVKIDGQ